MKINKSSHRIAAGAALLVASASGSFAQSKPITLPGSPLGIAWGFLYGTYGAPKEKFMPKVRQLGGGFTKVYLLWNQVEPEKGKYDWSAVDAFVKQLKSPDEGLVSLFSSSMWATRQPSSMLPPSPAKNPDDYYRFVRDLVKHCKGKVRYWQNDSEPNNPIYWAGTKEEFVDELKVFYRAVKDADPMASVVVGGYDGLFNPPGMPPKPNQQIGLAFFDYVLQNGSKAFDVFDIRLYADPYTIPARVEFMRQKMVALGYEKPIIATEYGGPGFFEFPENRKYASMVIAWSQGLQKPKADGSPGTETVAKSQIGDLYKNMSSLLPQTQMFMQGCPPELQAKFERIQARYLVMENVFALYAGVQKTLYWDLVNDASDRDNLMTLMYGKIPMLGYEGKTLSKKYPIADVFQRMTGMLRGVTAVKRIEVKDRPSVFLFEVDRARRAPVYVVWEKRDTLSGEDSPASSFEWPWTVRGAKLTDTFGTEVSVEVSATRLTFPISLTPIFVEPKR